jgi:hypothetical protein
MSCPHDPKTLTGAPIGMYHCPLCGDMVVAGMDHPDYSLLEEENEIMSNPYHLAALAVRSINDDMISRTGMSMLHVAVEPLSGSVCVMNGTHCLWDSSEDDRDDNRHDPTQMEPLVNHLKKKLWHLADDILNGLGLPHEEEQAMRMIESVLMKKGG